MLNQSISVTKDASSCHLFVFEIIKREDILKESRKNTEAYEAKQESGVYT